MRKVGIYKGFEIDDDMVTRVREIAKARYAKPIYDSSYWSIEDVSQLAYLHGLEIDDEILVLGEDWFLSYTVSSDLVELLGWVATQSKSSKFVQTVEMMNVLRNILYEYRDRQFLSDLRHDTSYQFY